MSETLRPKWPHLENLDRVLADYPDILSAVDDPDREWVVTEKLHGFNARFGVDENGVPWVGSRNNVVYDGDPAQWPADALQGFVGFAAKCLTRETTDPTAWDRVIPGETIFGEWAGKGIQKGIDYGQPDFYAFGVMFNGSLQSWDYVELVANLLGIKTVPVLVRVYETPQPVALQNLRTRKSSIAEQNGEGIVVSAYPPLTDSYGRPLIIKVKTPDFEERTRFQKKDVVIDLTAANGFAEEYCTEQRFVHVLQQALEEGPYDPLDVRMTGTVMRLMYEDCVREGAADYEALDKDQKAVVGKAINRLTKMHLTAARDSAMLARANTELAS